MFNECPGISNACARVTLDGRSSYGDTLALTREAEMLEPRQPSEA